MLDMMDEPLSRGRGEDHISRQGYEVNNCSVVRDTNPSQIQGQSRKRRVKVRYKVSDAIQRLITGSVVATVIWRRRVNVP
jgi:hypothetical protein